MRFAIGLIAALLALGAALPGALLAAEPGPRVVVIVGPAGEATDRYRERAEAAAQAAERFTSNVVRIYSPDATWPVVEQALDGAAVVIYLGHGNGWPSRYRDSPYGASQNGFGLNPVAGAGDEAHQYFGEDWIAEHVQLAPNAVVLLHHLCYASGNTEPGLPEGTPADARQRVDNYAAGFIRAGAAAVVAEGHMGPAWYVEQLLAGQGSIDAIWQRSPTAHGNVTSFSSDRSPGYVAALDPDAPESGFYRSIVYRGAVDATELTPGAPVPPLAPAEPSLVGTGLAVDAPYFKARPLAGAATELWVPFTTDDPGALDGLTVGVRWDPIDVAGPAPDDAATDPSAGPVTFIEPEQLGSIVDPGPASVGPTRIVVPTAAPTAPGRYRLVTTLHDASGVAFDAPTQALVPAMLVQVSGELGARYLVTPAVDVAAGAAFELPVGVANLGSRAWGQIGSGLRNLEERPIAGSLVAHWVRLVADDGELPGDTAERLPAGFGPGARERAVLGLEAPAAPGDYLLVLDVVVDGIGSLSAAGADPGIVRVTVTP